MATHNISSPIILCNKKIEIPDTKGIVVTYCMRPIGHKGECAVNKQKEDV